MGFGKTLGVISNKLKREIDNRVSRTGVSSTSGHILGYIYCSKKDVYQKDIEDEFQLRRSSVTSVLQNLEKQGYIERLSVPQDQRLKKIVLTPTGLEVQKSILKIIDGVDNEAFSCLNKEEFEKFVEYNNRILKNIEKF